MSNFAERFKENLERQRKKGSPTERYTGEQQGVFAPSERKQEVNAPHLVAREARESGDQLLQLVLPVVETRRGVSRVTGWPDDVARSQSRHSNALEAVEAEGWRLEHASYVFEETGSVSRDQFFKTGQTARVTGRVLGVYIFRRDDANRAETSA